MFFKRKKNQELSDFELVEKYRYSHNTDYLGELYQRYISQVTVICLKYLKNSHDAEDAVMDIFETLVKDLKRHSVENFKHWLLRVTRNHCLKKLSRDPNFKSNPLIVKKDFSNMELAAEVDLDNEEELNANLEELKKAMSKLPNEQKKCLELFYMEGKKYVEVAESTGYSLKQVKSYLQNGKRNLKSAMAR